MCDDHERVTAQFTIHTASGCVCVCARDVCIFGLCFPVYVALQNTTIGHMAKIQLTTTKQKIVHNRDTCTCSMEPLKLTRTVALVSFNWRIFSIEFNFWYFYCHFLIFLSKLRTTSLIRMILSSVNCRKCMLRLQKISILHLAFLFEARILQRINTMSAEYLSMCEKSYVLLATREMDKMKCMWAMRIGDWFVVCAWRQLFVWWVMSVLVVGTVSSSASDKMLGL